jgi:electron transport complex protein RnfG
MIKDIFKNNFVRMIGALVAVGALSGATLVMVYTLTTQRIKDNRNKESEQAVVNLFPDADIAALMKGSEKGTRGIVEVVDKNKKLLGYAFKAEGNGYQGAIEIIGGLNADLSQMQGIEIVESQETPGLGAEIAGDNFRKQFVGLSVAHPIEYVKNQKPQQPYQIEAITGATISSRAVVNILNKRIEEVRKIIKGE